jgi:RNA polymerase sigma-70 factor, ECF subfamily
MFHLGQPAPHSGDPADRLVLFDLISRLERDRREAFVLTQILGFSYAETAGVCACPVGTIRSRVARARTDLLALTDRSEGNANIQSGPRS